MRLYNLTIGRIDRGEFNFDKSFLHFNVKKYICKELLEKNNLNLTVNIEY